MSRSSQQPPSDHVLSRQITGAAEVALPAARDGRQPSRPLWIINRPPAWSQPRLHGGRFRPHAFRWTSPQAPARWDCRQVWGKEEGANASDLLGHGQLLLAPPAALHTYLIHLPSLLQ